MRGIVSVWWAIKKILCYISILSVLGLQLLKLTLQKMERVSEFKEDLNVKSK